MTALAGLCVLNPRPAAQSAALNVALRAAGAEVWALPLLDIEVLPATPEDEAMIADLDRCDGIVVVSANAARALLSRVAERWPQWPSGIALLAVGRATAQVLADAGLSVQVPSQEDSEGLLALPRLQQVAGQRWLLARGEGGRELLAETLHARGAQVLPLALYRRVLPDAAACAWSQRTRLPDVVLLSSALVWSHWQQVAGDQACRPCLVTVSARLAEQVRAAGAGEVVNAGGASPEHWLEALQHWRCRAAHGIQSDQNSSA